MFLQKHTTFDHLEASWQQVWSSMSIKLPFNSYYWAYTWYKIFPEGKLSIYGLFDDNKNPLGFASLKQIKDTIYWQAGEEVTDYEDLVCEDKYKEEFWDLIIEDLLKIKSQTLILRNIPESSITRNLLENISQRNKLDFKEDEEDVVPFIKLPASYESYLESLTRKDRHELRRKWRRFEEEAKGNWQLVKSTPETHDKDCHHFFTLFRQNGEGKRLFLTPPMEDFFCQVTSSMQKIGLLDFSSLMVNKEIIAQTISFVNSKTLYLYNMAVNPNCYHFSPGIIINKLLIEESISKGRKIYDFMQGNERYKYQLGAGDGKVYKINIRGNK